MTETRLAQADARLSSTGRCEQGEACCATQKIELSITRGNRAMQEGA